jgi:hypothetical protein
METINHKYESDDAVIECVIDDEKAKNIVEKLLSWFDEYGHIGECICQSDDAQVYSTPALAEIADDIIKFEVTYGN